MTAGASVSSAIVRLRAASVVRSGSQQLRVLVIAAGLCWAVLFVGLGVLYELQMYGDGAIFSYAVAVQDSWGFHWRNISGRLFAYVFSHLPAEIYVALTSDARGGIALYGALFFSAPLLGLAATWAADRSSSRVFFTSACLSTACLDPLVFGSPTETWMAQALFWPTLSLSHYGRAGWGGIALLSLAFLALVFTHEGGVLFALAILCTLLPRGWRDRRLRNALAVLIGVAAIWAAVKIALPPDDYAGSALYRAALHVFDSSVFTGDLMRLLFETVAGYAIVFLLVKLVAPARAHILAGSIVALLLAVHWLWFDHALHAENRYYLRSVILLAVPALGLTAAAYALRADGRLNPPFVAAPRLLNMLAAQLRPQRTAEATAGVMARAATGAFVLVLLVHAVETAKFITAWTNYKAAVGRLAMSSESDPQLGDARFVSSQRISTGDNRLGWSSTSHFLSVLLAPGLAPARLVVDPQAAYFWLPCRLAMANEASTRAVPARSRELIRVHACLHRSFEH
jgi:hypothetical protein